MTSSARAKSRENALALPEAIPFLKEAIKSLVSTYFAKKPPTKESPAPTEFLTSPLGAFP